MKFFVKLFFLSTTCYLLTTTLTGCTTITENKASANNPNSLAPQSLLKFSDIPIPVGLKSLPEQSYSFESSGVRVGVLKYQGKNNPDQIVDFYKEQMPMYNWNLVNIIEYGQRLMNFERENESCIITLQSTGWGNTLIVISLGPKSQTVSKRSKSLVK